MNSPWGDHAVLVRRVSAMAVFATDLGGGMADGIACGGEGEGARVVGVFVMGLSRLSCWIRGR